MDHNKLKIFEDKKVRIHWDAEKEEWYFSVVDVCEVLAEATNPRRYWSDLKRKLIAEGSQLYGEIVQLKMLATDGKSMISPLNALDLKALDNKVSCHE